MSLYVSMLENIHPPYPETMKPYMFSRDNMRGEYLVDWFSKAKADDEITLVSTRPKMTAHEYLSQQQAKSTVSSSSAAAVTAPAPTLATVFVPMEEDSLFWLFYRIRHGAREYDILGLKDGGRNSMEERRYKMECIEWLRQEKEVLKKNKLCISSMEQNLAYENVTKIYSFLGLCLCEKKRKWHVLFVYKRCYLEVYSLPCKSDDADAHTYEQYTVLFDETTGKYALSFEPYDVTNHHKLEMDRKIIKSMTSYTVAELCDISKKLLLETHVTGTGTTTAKCKSKKDLYEQVVQYVSSCL
jgi:hypothetical protein